jgi:hypothetical protein
MKWKSIFWLLLCAAVALGQSPATPETGYLSAEKYTNAYFGFILPLPHDIALLGQSGPNADVRRHTLFSANNPATASVLIVFADDISSKPETPEHMLRGLGAKKVERASIAGHDFWIGEWTVKDAAFFRCYSVEMKGFLVSFTMAAPRKENLRDFQPGIEAITFFDLASAREQAGPDSRPYNGPPSSPRQ